MVSVWILTIAVLAVATSCNAWKLTATNTSTNVEEETIVLGKFSENDLKCGGNGGQITLRSGWQNIKTQLSKSELKPVERTCVLKVAQQLKDSNNYDYDLTETRFFNGKYTKVDISEIQAVDGGFAGIQFTLKTA